jgi:hypothetical protein
LCIIRTAPRGRSAPRAQLTERKHTDFIAFLP